MDPQLTEKLLEIQAEIEALSRKAKAAAIVQVIQLMAVDASSNDRTPGWSRRRAFHGIPRRRLRRAARASHQYLPARSCGSWIVRYVVLHSCAAFASVASALRVPNASVWLTLPRFHVQQATHAAIKLAS